MKQILQRARDIAGPVGVVLLVMAVLTLAVGPWAYHVIWCIAAIATGAGWIVLALLVFGTIVAPIGWIHGAGLVLGLIPHWA